MYNKFDNTKNFMDIKRIRGYIHTHDEAMLLVHAIRLGLIKPTIERPTIEERESIRDGSIYCFKETEEGMKRWTDGKIWSPSKILGHFLLYKEVPRHLSKNAIKKEKDSSRWMYERMSRENYLDDSFTLHKKTISLIHDNTTYHVIAYFQPFFDKKSISTMPFFMELETVISINRKLRSDSYVRHCIDCGDSMFRMFRLPHPKIENFIHQIDRESLEKTAILVLQNKMRSQTLVKQ